MTSEELSTLRVGDQVLDSGDQTWTVKQIITGSQLRDAELSHLHVCRVTREHMFVDIWSDSCRLWSIPVLTLEQKVSRIWEEVSL